MGGSAIPKREADLKNQTILQRLFEAGPDGLVVTDEQGQILQVNAQAEKMFGYSRDELLGQTVELLMAERFREIHAAHRREYAADPRIRPVGAGLNLYAQRKDASEFPVDILLSPLETEEGLIVLSVVRDITERKQAEEALRHNELQLRGILDNSTAVIYLKDTAGRFLRINRQFETLFGFRRWEIVGKTDYDLFPKDKADRFRANDRQVLEAGAPLEFEEVAPQSDGLHTYISIKFPLFDSAGKPYAVGGISTDITERKRTEDALRLSEQRFRLLVEGVKDYAIFTLDPEGRVSSWNQGAERLSGYSAGEILGQDFACYYTREDIARGQPAADLKTAAALGRLEDEGWRVRKDGSRFWANVILTALRTESGELQGFAKVTRDFTERKQAEEALLLEITNVLVSHLDIRNLLAAIAATIQRLMPQNYGSLALYDPGTRMLRLQVLSAPYDDGPVQQERWLPVEGSPAGLAFTSREPVVLNRMEWDRFRPELLGRWTAMGVKSACWLPLISRGRALGALVVASQRAAAFTEKDVRLLSQMAIQIAVALDNALVFRQIAELKDRLAEEKLYLESELRTEYNFEEIVGESAALKRVLKQVETVAPTEAGVLILGETGTGKELIARAIHQLCPRRERTFVKLNCAAIPSGLLESELFGHEKGAFTGAIAQKIGRLELAHRGTLFLDEVGDIPLELQPKLLRALQEKEFERLGSTRTIPVDVRLVAATNRDLAQMVEDRQFRSDLYYRLRVFPITVPPLRDRPEDIPVLVRYFVQKHAQRMNKRIETITPEALEALTRWHWPGNVRELENLIERCVILTQGSVLHVPRAELGLPSQPPSPTSATLEAAEREHIRRALREARGVIAGPRGAAARLGLKRTTLNSKMRKLGITRQDL